MLQPLHEYFFTREERTRLRKTVLEYDTVPHNNSLTPDDRRKWKRHLSHRFRKPISEIGAEEFARANSFKYPSLLWTSLDAGLRPIEVERASTQWLNLDNAVIRIPADQAAKSTEHWRVSIRTRTAEFLRHWLNERELRDKYNETDQIWLTHEGNPYQSTSLKYFLGRLCEEAGIRTENRQLTWYALRHSVGTYMAREEGLAAARAQLRHRSIETTMKYDQAPVEDRRNALERMG